MLSTVSADVYEGKALPFKISSNSLIKVLSFILFVMNSSVYSFMISPTGIVKTPNKVPSKPVKILSYTRQAIEGAYLYSYGRIILKLTTVFRVGSDPKGPGTVDKSSTIAPEMGGTRVFNPNLIYAFLTGKIPEDSKDLSPKTLISMLYSSKVTTASVWLGSPRMPIILMLL